jgi:LPS export ABC transporter protein LptC
MIDFNLSAASQSVRRCTAAYAALLVVLLLVVLLSGCRDSGGSKQSGKSSAAKDVPSGAGKGVEPAKTARETPSSETDEKRPELKVVARQITMTWDEAGKTKMKATAREIVGNELTGTGMMKDAEVFWYDNGQLTTVMKAPQIEAQQSSKTLIATGGVVVRSIPRKTVVKSQWLKWYANEHKVIGNGGVTVTSDMGTINAAGLTADTELKTIKFVSQGSGGSASLKP